VKVLIVDPDCVGLDLAYRAAEGGHEVMLWQRPGPHGQPLDGRGFPGIEKVKSWQAAMLRVGTTGLVVNMFNDKEVTKALDAWRKRGYRIFGPTLASATLEHDRGAGMKLFEQLGFDVPPYQTFPNLDAALAAAWKLQDPMVMKPMGDEEDKSLTYVAHDPADLVSFLEELKAKGTKLKGKLMFQEKVDLLMEVGVSAWMSPKGFSEAHNVSVEYKKLMPGEYGPSTGEMGDLTKYYTDTAGSKLSGYLRKFEDKLFELGHLGDFAIGGALTTKGSFVPFEMSIRFGYPEIFAFLHCHLCDPIEWMSALVDGEDALVVDERPAICLVMATPPFPAPPSPDVPHEGSGRVITGIEQVWEHVSPVAMMIEDGPVWRDGKIAREAVYKTTGPYVCAVTAQGADVHDALETAYAAAERIKYRDRILRTDVGRDLEKKLPKARALGFTELPDW
jgi:phosphoribosylamine---glycine ligase